MHKIIYLLALYIIAFDYICQVKHSTAYFHTQAAATVG